MFRNVPPKPLAQTVRFPIFRMEEIWFFFKVVEAIYGFICIAFHIEGFLDETQPLPHQMYFCGTFFGFTIIALFGCLSIGLGFKMPLVMETITNGVASFFYLLSSLCSMYHVENDYHLMYLSDTEEDVHPFLVISRKQSIAALHVGLMYMLHATFAGDAFFITDVNMADLPEGLAKADIECYKPIKMYICGKTIHGWIMKKKWFRWLTGQELRSMKAEDAGVKKRRLVRDLLYVRSGEP